MHPRNVHLIRRLASKGMSVEKIAVEIEEREPPDVGRDCKDLQRACDRDSGNEEGLRHFLRLITEILGKSGIGWEDICVKCKITDPIARADVKRIVLEGIENGLPVGHNYLGRQLPVRRRMGVP